MRTNVSKRRTKEGIELYTPMTARQRLIFEALEKTEALSRNRQVRNRQDGTAFYRGLIIGLLISIPFWVIVGWLLGVI